MRHIIAFVIAILFSTSVFGADAKDSWYLGGSLGVGAGISLEAKIDIDWPSNLPAAIPVPSSTTYAAVADFGYTISAGKDFAIGEKQSLGALLSTSIIYAHSSEGKNTLRSGTKLDSGTKMKATTYSQVLQGKYAYYFTPEINMFVKAGIGSITAIFEITEVDDKTWARSAAKPAFIGAFGLGAEYILNEKHAFFLAADLNTPFKTSVRNEAALEIPGLGTFNSKVTVAVPVTGALSLGYRYLI